MQRGEQLMPFKTKSGDTLEILYLGELTAEVSTEAFLHRIDYGWLITYVVSYVGCFLPCRRSLPKSISITVWRPGAWGLQAGPSCSSAFSWPCGSSTRWVNIDLLRQKWSPPLLFLTLSAPCLQWTGFLFSESWCPWGWRSSRCACPARCLSSPLQQVGFFIVHWWLRLWQRSLWSRCFWPVQAFQPRRRSDCLKGKRASGAREQRCCSVVCPPLGITLITALL